MKTALIAAAGFAALVVPAQAATDYWWTPTEETSVGSSDAWTSYGKPIPNLTDKASQCVFGGTNTLAIVAGTVQMNALIFSGEKDNGGVTDYYFEYTAADSVIKATTISKWSSSNLRFTLSADAKGALDKNGYFVLLESENPFGGDPGEKLSEVKRVRPENGTGGNWIDVTVDEAVAGSEDFVLSGSVYSSKEEALEALSSLVPTCPYAVVATSTQLMLVTTAPIPEPSAFGLLAGLGALALVASRRRRK